MMGEERGLGEGRPGDADVSGLVAWSFGDQKLASSSHGDCGVRVSERVIAAQQEWWSDGMPLFGRASCGLECLGMGPEFVQDFVGREIMIPGNLQLGDDFDRWRIASSQHPRTQQPAACHPLT